MPHVRLTPEGVRLLEKGLLDMATLGMRGTGEFVDGIRERINRITATPDVQQGTLMFGAQLYRCIHCGTRYESLPTLQGAVKCRNCGAGDMRIVDREFMR